MYNQRTIHDLSIAVTASIFGVREWDVVALQAGTAENSNEFSSIPRQIMQLFKFQGNESYIAAIASARKSVRELTIHTQSILENPFTGKLATEPLPRIEDLNREFGRIASRKFRSGNATFTAPDNWAKNLLANISQSRSSIERDLPTFESRKFCSTSLERTLEEVERVATDGSAHAAYLYFTRMTRCVLPEKHEERHGSLMEKAPKLRILAEMREGLFFRILRLSGDLDFAKSYIEVGRLGLEGILDALDKEESRTRYPKGLRYLYLQDFIYTPSLIVDFALRMKKKEINPASAGELLRAIPVGQRKAAFREIDKNHDILKLYDALKPHGVSAASYVSFMNYFSNVEITMDGQARQMQAVVMESAKNSKEAAAWLVNYPELLAIYEPAYIIGVTRKKASGQRLALLQAALNDKAKRQAALELEPKLGPDGLKKLARALSVIDSDSLTGMEVTLEGILALEPASLLQEKSSRHDWAEIAYTHNPGLLHAITATYHNLPTHLKHRVKQIDNYARHKGVREDGLFKILVAVNNLSPELQMHILGDDGIFQAALPRVTDEHFMAELEEAARTETPHLSVYRKVVRTSGGLSNKLIKIALEEEDETDQNFGIVYRIGIIADIENSRAWVESVAERLSDTGIEPVFISFRKRGNLPHCDGFLIHPGGRMPHFASARNVGGMPVRVINGGYGADAVARAAIAFRNYLLENAA
ncbi:hypothetical protein HY640_05335 [Candidatus Woesearchaeota archaeon]|nr:hypothetical protein [Candidatus Woesearchaeota archaeon]